MLDSINEFIKNITGDNIALATIIISMIPMLELKGAIPFAMNTNLFGENALTFGWALFYGFLGSIFIVPIIAVIFKPIYNYLKDIKFFKSIMQFLIGDIERKASDIQTTNATKTARKLLVIKMFSVFTFVALPLPLTGVYTGTCLAVILGLNFWTSCASVLFGNLVAGLIITSVCAIFPNFANILLYIFILIIIVFLTWRIIVHFKKKNNHIEKLPNN